MTNKLSFSFFHLQIVKTLLLTINAAGFIVYSIAQLIFFDFPFNIADQALILMKAFGVCSLFALGISFIVLLADAAEMILKKRNAIILTLKVNTAVIAFISLILLLSSCNTPVGVGIRKDFNTGMSSSYIGMEPEKVLLVMNNEVLTHTDIPLGESFLVVNDGIKGMKAENGKVKVGCSLSITDQKGTVVLDEKDLFAGHDEFDKKDAKMLKCTVNTGEPMKWEEKYNVAVTFWDKNGTGKIENKVTIRSIDMP